MLIAAEVCTAGYTITVLQIKIMFYCVVTLKVSIYPGKPEKMKRASLAPNCISQRESHESDSINSKLV
uniref:Uncharacterized protein n=1 Tax=Anguilla anguilla TaxID=7936 RepID=A0A0E9THA3_ANGAN